jgi:excisionase family DNA binding protein
MRPVASAVPTPREMLTIDQAAERINMSARYVRRLIAERRIVFYRFGRAVRIDPADLAAHMTAGRVEPLTPTTAWSDLRSAA